MLNGDAGAGNGFLYPPNRPPEGKAQNAPSWVKVYPGSEAPLAFLATFTRTVGTSGADKPAGRNTAYWVNTSLYIFVTR